MKEVRGISKGIIFAERNPGGLFFIVSFQKYGPEDKSCIQLQFTTSSSPQLNRVYGVSR
jgi:hypothetical protein